LRDIISYLNFSKLSRGLKIGKAKLQKPHSKLFFIVELMDDRCDSSKCNENTCGVMGTLTDFITGKKLPDTFAERIRQKTERFLVEKKNYAKEDIEVGTEFEIDLNDEKIKPKADLILRVGGKRVVVMKCVYGVLTAGERLVVSYGRLLDSYQIPFAVITNWEETNVLDTVTGKIIGNGLEAIPAKDDLDIEMEFLEYPEERIEKEKRILSAYEAMNKDLCSAF
jgi:hypothetical protein